MTCRPIFNRKLMVLTLASISCNWQMLDGGLVKGKLFCLTEKSPGQASWRIVDTKVEFRNCIVAQVRLPIESRR